MFADDYKEVKSLGGDGIKTPSSRTDDQTAIGLFWWESSPLKWSRIARTIAGKTDNNLWQNARLFALLDMTLADGYIAMSASKNYYNFWRPVTAIQNGEVGGNPDTPGDPNWKTFRRPRPTRIIHRAIPSKVEPVVRFCVDSSVPIRSAFRTVA